MYVTANLLSTYRIGLALLGLCLVFGYYLYYADANRTRKRIYTTVLALTALSSLYLFLEMGPQFGRSGIQQLMNPHDFFHYYVGSKYHRELGYHDLYECTLVADQETDRFIRPEWTIRDLRTYGMRRASEVLREHRTRCKRLYTPERWREFRADVSNLARRMAPTRWNTVLQDKGYNATPVWTAYASIMTNRVAPDSTLGVLWLLGLDWLFTAAIFVVVGLTFGWRNCLLVMIFWGVNVTTSFGFVSGSISRLDWLLCLFLAIALLKRGGYARAGVLAGVATALRVFPVLFFVALGFKAIHALVRTRRLPASYLRFGAAFGLSVALLLGMSSLTRHGRESWGEFAIKISTHDEYVAGYRVGLRYAMVESDAVQSKTAAAQSLESRQTLFRLVQLLALIALFLVAPRFSDAETLGISFVCVFVLTAPTFYYYQMLAIPFLLYLPDLRNRRLALGGAGFFVWCVMGYTLRLLYPLGLPLSRLLSWSLIGLSLLMLLLALGGARRDPSPETLSRT